jgi:hypothetical protein
MERTKLNLEEALRTSLPKMMSDKKALDALIEILEEWLLFSDNFDMSSHIV